MNHLRIQGIKITNGNITHTHTHLLCIYIFEQYRVLFLYIHAHEHGNFMSTITVITSVHVGAYTIPGDMITWSCQPINKVQLLTNQSTPTVYNLNYGSYFHNACSSTKQQKQKTHTSIIHVAKTCATPMNLNIFMPVMDFSLFAMNM